MAINGQPIRKLSPKQQRFIAEYLIDLNATQAAIRAGYSEHTAEQQGYQLLQKTSVQSALAEAMAEQSERVEIDADYVIERLKTEAELTGEGSTHGARVSALGLLGKHLGMFIEKHNVNLVQTTKLIELPPVGQEDFVRGDDDRSGSPSRVDTSRN